METIENGWIKMYRNILKSKIWANPVGLQIWIWILLNVRYDKEPKYVNLKTGKGFTTVKLEQGQMIFGRKAAALELGQNETTIYTWVRKLASQSYDSMISLQPKTHFTIIQVNNWSKYQNGVLTTNEQPNDNQMTTNEQPNDNQMTTNEQPNDNQMTQPRKNKNTIELEARVPKADTREVEVPGGNKVVSFDIEKDLSSMNTLGKNLPPMAITSDLEQVDLSDIDFDLGFDMTGEPTNEK